MRMDIGPFCLNRMNMSEMTANLNMIEIPAAVLPKWRIGARIFAPFYLLMFSLFRCYVETEMLAVQGYFSYYTALHHLLWNAATLTMIILVTHLLTKVPVVRLLWLMYGVTLMAIPLIFAVATGENLSVEYLRGSLVDVFFSIATFCLTYARNRPLSLEILLIFISMAAVGYAYTNSWKRALALALGVHLLGNLFAIHWLGPEPYSRSVVTVKTQLTHHQFMAAEWLVVQTLLAILFVRQAGWMSSNRRVWQHPVLWGVSCWIVCIAGFKMIGWFSDSFDLLVAGLPLAFLAFGLGLFFPTARKSWSWVAVGIFGAVLIIQMAVLGPIYLDAKERLHPTVRSLPAWLVPLEK